MGEEIGFWEVLAEMEAKRLSAYGDVPPELAEYVDPRAHELLHGMMGLSDAVRNYATTVPDHLATTGE